jgi:solute carrier family 25 (mitochondrial phosphate transporter), member 23/24/25/41
VFIIHTERELRSLFDRIDTSQNGKLEFEEVQAALESTGIRIHSDVLHAFFDSVDANHDGAIEFDEWRNFLILVPLDKATMRNVFQYYQEKSQMTYEGDALVSFDTMRSVRYFLAGGIAGVVSRTATAPFDRLKTYLIANTGAGKQLPVTGAAETVKIKPKGQLGKAVRRISHPLLEGIRTIYHSGGIRSFFVGPRPANPSYLRQRSQRNKILP